MTAPAQEQPRLTRALEDLAGQAPHGSPDPTLFARATRAHRARRAWAAAALVVLVVGLGSVAGIGALGRTTGSMAPASGSLDGGLPSVVSEVSPYLPGTGGKPWDPVAVLMEGERATGIGAFLGRTTPGVVAVSTAGEYRFLDLPDDAAGGYALSPDGVHVAFWVTGDPTANPNTGEPIIGVGVYDVVSAATQRYPIESAHGLDPRALTWVDDDRVAFDYGAWLGGEGDDEMSQSTSAHAPGTVVWTPATGAASVVDGFRLTAAGAGFLLDTSRNTCLDLASGARTTVRPPHGISGAYAVGNGCRVAHEWRRTSPGWPSVASEDRTTRYRQVARMRQPLAVDETSLTYWGPSATTFGPRVELTGYAVWRLDLRSGETTQVVGWPRATYGTPELIGLATGYAHAPTIQAQPPVGVVPLPWLVVGGVVALLASVAVLGWGLRRTRVTAPGRGLGERRG
ncbi:hypothetical protein [Nocardioides sp. GY 10127]|uniref:hypothetical protein n=1 Tax=Nocardioides sp. GY 10127 TaxID=2569762 RepID=UPI0010A7CB76|nr:hypothetical protein [Nocardioides sp. GY 10127]TIC86620.1 hypothetical protein E8D37_01660 [Nocardioides sp. GY 10127]